MITNDSLSNYIFSVAGRTAKSISGDKSIIQGTVASQSYNNYSVQLSDGGIVTAQTLGSGSYKKEDSVYLLKTSVSGGESGDTNKYFIISHTAEKNPIANVTLRDNFEPKGADYTINVTTNKPVFSSELINELKQYGAFKLSFNVTLEGEEIQDKYLLLKLNDNNDSSKATVLYGCKSSLGDWRGDTQARLAGVLQEQVYFLEGANINNIKSITFEKSEGISINEITIRPGVISRNSDDFTATLTCSQNGQSRDYVQSDEELLTLQTSIYYNDKSLYASGIKYYWQCYDKNTEKWIDLNKIEPQTVTIPGSNSFKINYIESDDNNFVISGKQLLYYNNKLRCICYYGNVEIVTNIIEVKNFTHIDYKIERYNTKDNIKIDITNNTRYIFNSEDEAIQISALITAEEFSNKSFYWGIRALGENKWTKLMTERVTTGTNENTGATEDIPLDPANIVTLFGNGENMKNGTKYITICQEQIVGNKTVLIEVGEESIKLSKNFGFSPYIRGDYWVTKDGETGVKAKGEDGASITQAKITTSSDGKIVQIIFVDSNKNDINATITTKEEEEDEEIIPPPYWIGFDANGGVFTDNSSFKSIWTDENGVLSGTDITNVIGTENPTRDKYIFRGWDPYIFTDADNTNTFKQATQIYATWEPDESLALETEDNFSVAQIGSVYAGVSLEGTTFYSENSKVNISFSRGDNENLKQVPILSGNQRYILLRPKNQVTISSPKNFFNVINFIFNESEHHIPDANNKLFISTVGNYDYNSYRWDSGRELISTVTFTNASTGSIAIKNMIIGVQK